MEFVLYLAEDVVNSHAVRLPPKYSQSDRHLLYVTSNKIENRRLVEHGIFLGTDSIQPRLWIQYTNRRDPSPYLLHFLRPLQQASPPPPARPTPFPQQQVLRPQMQMGRQDMP